MKEKAPAGFVISFRVRGLGSVKGLRSEAQGLGVGVSRVWGSFGGFRVSAREPNTPEFKASTLKISRPPHYVLSHLPSALNPKPQIPTRLGYISLLEYATHLELLLDPWASWDEPSFTFTCSRPFGFRV